MCNRIRTIKDWDELRHHFRELPRLNFQYDPNVAPTDLAPAMLAQDGPPLPVIARFGFTYRGRQCLNARGDTYGRGYYVQAKAQRCVIPVAGFYEFREEEDGKKHPYMFSRKDGLPLMLAGIWENADHKGDTRPSFAIVTDDPNDLIAPYHDRMPLALADDQVDAWLDLSNQPTPSTALLLDLDAIGVTPMARAMNSPRQKDPAAMELHSGQSTGLLL